MRSLLSSEIERLAQIYVVANTPSYLYRHFLQDQSVQSLANENTVEELVSLAKSNVGAKAGSIDGVVSAYAALAALTLKSYEQIEAVTKVEKFPELDWGNPILSLWEQSRKSTQKITISPKISNLVATPNASFSATQPVGRKI